MTIVATENFWYVRTIQVDRKTKIRRLRSVFEFFWVLVLIRRWPVERRVRRVGLKAVRGLFRART